jgi:hypothetical protein
MEIDTKAVRGLRDSLIAQGRFSPDARSESASRRLPAEEREAIVNRVAPFVETMYLMIMADHEDVESEWDAVRGAIRVFTEGLLDETQIDEMLHRIAQARREDGPEARLQYLGARISAERADREAAFALAAVAALADDTVVIEENRLLEEMADWYGISNARRNSILEELGTGL